MKVLKFGGTSVGSAQRMRHVADLITTTPGTNIVVLSAMSGTTNTLVDIAARLASRDIETAREIAKQLRSKYSDVLADLIADEEIASQVKERIDEIFATIERAADDAFTSADEKEILACGELLSTALMYGYFQQCDVKCVMLPALDYMRTVRGGEPDGEYITNRLKSLIRNAPEADIYLTQGYICRNAFGEIDNLRRGGSDYSASIIGAALDVEEIQIWTDIDGMHTGDPRVVADTRSVEKLHFNEAAELAYFGAKILHPDCVLPARLKNIPVKLLNTLDPDATGTTISNTTTEGTLKAVAAKDNVTFIAIRSNRSLTAGEFLCRVFRIVEKFGLVTDLSVVSGTSVKIAFAGEVDLSALTDALKPLGVVTAETGQTIICVAGDFSPKQSCRFAVRVLESVDTLPVKMIDYGASRYSISMVIDMTDKHTALNLLNEHLF